MTMSTADRSSTTSTLAVISLVSGIAAWTLLPLVGALAAVICGHYARSDIRRAPPGERAGDGMAITGLVLGYAQLFMALFIALVIGTVLFDLLRSLFS